MPAGNGRLAALARRVRGLDGWRRRLVALLAGAASVLAMAPFFAWPVLWITLTVLVWLIDGTSPAWRGADAADRRARADHLIAAAGAGWWFGFGYFLAGLFWVGEAFLVEAETFAVLLPFAVTLLPAGMALYWGGAAALAARFWSARPCRVLVLALALSAAEWLRGHLLTGFPWNLLGYALTYPLPLMQSAALVGVYGLTLVAVIVFALPPVAWSEAPAGKFGRRRRAGALALAVVPIAIMATLGAIRLARADASTVPGVKVRIVQPSVPQREKWRPEHQERIFLEHLRLSATNPAGETDSAGITHIVWPEAALPFLVLDHPAARAAIGRSLPRGALLIAGALRAEPAPAGSPRPRRIFNSLLVLGEGGSLVGLYDKTHLVPFGEYLPLQGLLRSVGLGWLVGMRGGFDTGVTPRPLLSAPGLPPAAPLICYEAIFPAAVVQGPQRPGLLLNVTNDGWFGDTTGPRQHLHQARVRAVEEGLPLLRAANNGVSAAIDGYGRILARLDLDVRGVIDVPLPAALPPPPYARLGDLTLLLLWLAGAALVALCMRR